MTRGLPDPASGPAPAGEAFDEAFDSAFDSAAYWETRYRRNRTSGAGSYGRLATFKAGIVNAIIATTGARSVIDLGCGDGNQLALLEVPDYLGVDVSPTVIDRCKARWPDDPGRRFMLDAAFDPKVHRADLALSMDVLYHLIEDHVFDRALRALFTAARATVIIYACDGGVSGPTADHVRVRRFSPWIAEHAPGWRLWRRIGNMFPADPGQPGSTSFADFFIYRPVEPASCGRPL